MSDNQVRFMKLGWEILEHKYRYHGLDTQIISEFSYDMLEKEYEALAIVLGLPPTVTDMPGLNTNRPCTWTVAAKVDQQIESQRKKRLKKLEAFQVGDSIRRKKDTGWDQAPDLRVFEVLDIHESGHPVIEFVGGRVSHSHSRFYTKV